MKDKWIFLIIFSLGFLLRVIFINSSPPSLYGDELTITLDAYSLLQTGYDQLGNFLPLTFPMGAGRPAGYVYGSIPFVAIFGPSALGVRALSIMSGIGIIILLYLLGRKVFSAKVGLLAALIGAVSPWEISLSRGGFEAHFALFLALLGIYLFIKARDKPLLYIFSALSFGLTLHTYPTYKVSLLFFLPLLLWYQSGIKKALTSHKKFLFGGAAVLIVLGILSLSQTFFNGSETRFSNINIFSQDTLNNSIVQKINLERQLTKLPQSLAKYFHNKPVEYSKILIENYLQNFSMDFLVLHGDRNPRHNMATMGELYFVEIILILVGLVIFWQRQRKTINFYIFWILLSPIASAIIDLPHALRSAFMLPPLIILSALGLYSVINFKNKIPLFLIGFLFIIQFTFFIQKLYFLAPTEYSSFWSYPAKLATEITMKNKNQYDYIFLSDKIADIEFAYPVYAKVDPRQVISQNTTKSIIGSYAFKNFDNVYIRTIPESEIEKFLSSLSGKILYIGSLDALKYLKNYETVDGINNFNTLVMTKR